MSLFFVSSEKSLSAVHIYSCCYVYSLHMYTAIKNSEQYVYSTHMTSFSPGFYTRSRLIFTWLLLQEQLSHLNGLMIDRHQI